MDCHADGHQSINMDLCSYTPIIRIPFIGWMTINQIQSICNLLTMARVFQCSRRDLLADALMIIGKRWLNRSPAAAGTPGDVRVCEVWADVGPCHGGWWPSATPWQVVLSDIDGHQQLTGSTLALVAELSNLWFWERQKRSKKGELNSVLQYSNFQQ